MQWRHVMTEASSGASESSQLLSLLDAENQGQGHGEREREQEHEQDHFDGESDGDRETGTGIGIGIGSMMPEGLDFELGGGDESGAVKPWLGKAILEKGLLLCTGGGLFHAECCIIQLWCSLIVLHTITSMYLTDHHTNI